MNIPIIYEISIRPSEYFGLDLCQSVDAFNVPHRKKTALRIYAAAKIQVSLHTDSHSLVRVFTERILDSQECKMSLCGQR